MLSTSPLCPHIEQGSGADWLRALPVRPKAVKVFSSGACRDIKALDPAILTIKRRYVPDQDAYLNEAAAGGRRFVREQDDLEGVDILEGLNECVPSGDAQAIRRANAFHLGFVEECLRRGVRPCILNIATGNPEVIRDGQPWDGEVRLLVESIQAAVDADGFVGYHGYGPMRLLHAEDFHSFRDVLRIEPLLRGLGVTGRIRWLHSEAGFDGVNEPGLPSGGWRQLVSDGHLTVQGVCDEYARYARRCQELGVEIACLFTFWGTAQWRKYEHTDVAKMMAWLGQHWTEVTSPAPVPQPLPQPQPEPIPSSAPKVVYAAPGPGYTFINVRRSPDLSDASDMGDIPRGQAILVEAEEGDFYKIVAYVARSVTSPAPPASSEPRLAYPVRGRSPKINHPYGEPRSYGPHEGLDLYARQDDVIVPVLDGVVDKVRQTDPGSGYGIYVRVHHDLRATLGKEYKSWYAHLSQTLVEEGMEVEAGQTPLGHAGSSGNSTGVHLHLTLQEVGLHNGMVVDGAIDPEPHLFK